MKLSSRTLVLASGWILAIAIGFLIGRQTGGSTIEGAGNVESIGRLPRFARGSGLQDQRPSLATKRPGSSIDASPRRSRERTIAELGEALRLPDRLSRTRRILDLAEKLSPDEFEEVVEVFRADGISRMRGTEYSLLLHAWVNADPFAAAGYVDAHDDSPGSRRTVMAAWAAIDAGSAKAWIADRGDDGDTNDWLVGLASGVASNDPDQALPFIEEMESAAIRSKSMQAVIPHVLQHGVDYATEWVAGIGNEELQLGTVRHLARELARLDADQAGAWITTMESGQARREATAIIADQWARSDLESAKQWAAGLPAENRAEAAGGIAKQMARLDPEQAAVWLNSLGTDPSLDSARRTFISEASAKAPQVALENVYTLTKPSEQEKMYSYVLKQWSQKNAKSVQTWVAYNTDALPASVVKRFAPAPKPVPREKPKKESKKPDRKKLNKQSRKQGKA